MTNNHQQCEEEENEVNIGNGILRKEVVAAIKSLKKGKSARLENIPSELIVNGGNSIIDLMHRIYSIIYDISISCYLSTSFGSSYRIYIIFILGWLVLSSHTGD